MTILEAVTDGDANLVEDLLRSVSDNTLNQLYKDSNGKSYTVLDKARELSGSNGKRILKMLSERNAKSAKRMSSKKTRSKGGRLPARKTRRN
jgi:hypothetical protein